MIVKVLNNRETMVDVLDYNYNKVKAGTARMVCAENLNHSDEASVRHRFEWLEHGNFRSKNVSFHLAINPNPSAPKEQMSNSEMVSFAKEIMEALGLAEQPYVIFEHHDIDRVHYHLVSIRIKEDGRQIGYFHDRNILKETCIRLQDKYRFTYGKEKAISKKNNTSSIEIKKHFAMTGERVRFVPGKDVKEQFQMALDSSRQYGYSTFAQFSAVMEECGFRVKLGHHKGYSTLTYQGLYRNGKPATAMINDDPSGREYYKQFYEGVIKDRHGIKDRPDILLSLRKTLENCIRTSRDEQQFIREAAKKGIGVHFNKNEDNRINQVIIIDRNKLQVYKASEISRSMTAQGFQHLIDTGIWSEQIKMKPSHSDVHGIGVHPVPQDDKPEEIAHESSPSYQAEPSIVEELMYAIAAHTSPSKGKDLQKKKKKVKKARYL